MNVQVVGSYLFFIYDEKRKGWLSWNSDDGKKYLMAWTSEEKALEYNDRVLQYRPGIVKAIHRSKHKEIMDFCKASGIKYMLLDFPGIEDDMKPIETRLHGYCIVELK